MRYILNDEGYIETVSFTYEVECNNKTCTEYTGSVPTGYETLAEWSENANINAYKVVNGELTYDSDKDTELQSLWASQMQSNSTGDTFPIGAVIDYDGETVPDGYEEVPDTNAYSTEEQVIGTWIDGKTLYRKSVLFNNVAVAKDVTLAHGISNVDKIVNQKGTFIHEDTSNVETRDYPVVSSSGAILGFYAHRTNIVFVGNDSWSANTKRSHIFTLEYTKTTD